MKGSRRSGDCTVITADGEEISLAGMEVTVEVPVKAVSMSDEPKEYRLTDISFLSYIKEATITIRCVQRMRKTSFWMRMIVERGRPCQSDDTGGPDSIKKKAGCDMMNIRFSRKQLCIPYALFLICFVILPLAVIVYYAFTDGSGRFTLENLLSFFTNGNTIGTLCYSLVIAAVVTAVCLLVAYPAAYVLARSGLKRGPVILMLFILPMWINFTLRITALKEILTVLEGNLSLHPVPEHGDRYDL